MPAILKCFPVVLLVAVLSSIPDAAQGQASNSQRDAEADAAALGSLCFQCHGGGMWSDHRADRRGWESVLYRMIGRGAVWTDEEVRRMANYLDASFGPDVSRSTAGKLPRKERP